ncbi:Crp/Fnr family transcriptional regulator [Sulfitobacter alexandrii]|uniref:Crp/Fnr family transcriptional regulator n=1 Tax=Sulfitobacter alexandrii TaxID=1917485 RepID=A0A1J0WJF9_9RHOB|nr:Crp/Fnr family transcriptional regulator [Sulfitobacter alexandrii]APE44471.1 Crp/Fnr family transcriptional regulator [Sulfitobacter alexandrii]
MSRPWIDRFPGLSRLEEPIRQHLLDNSILRRMPRGTILFGPGNSPENMLFLLDGSVRVQQTAESGREIVLYRILAGESCVLTTACLLAFDDYSAEGIAETDVEAAALPRRVFDDLVASSEPFRTFVFSAFSKRMTDLFLIIEEVAFGRIDVRLAHKLGELAAGASSVMVTHQQLSVELGTAREVISRQLQEFQRRGWIAQSRGTITLVEPGLLADLGSTGG